MTASQVYINDCEEGQSHALAPQSLMAAAITLVLSVLLAFALWKITKRLPRPNLPLPPGPRGWPIIGNLFQIPRDFEHETYHGLALRLDAHVRLEAERVDHRNEAVDAI